MEYYTTQYLVIVSNSDLKTTDNDSNELLETMRRYNDACNFVSDMAFSLKVTNNKYKLHKIVSVCRDKRQV
jgi:predicted transposase